MVVCSEIKDFIYSVRHRTCPTVRKLCMKYVLSYTESKYECYFICPLVSTTMKFNLLSSEWRSVHILFHVCVFHVFHIAVVSGCENVIFLTDFSSQVELNVLSVSTTRAWDSSIVAIMLFPIFCTYSQICHSAGV